MLLYNNTSSYACTRCRTLSTCSQIPNGKLQVHFLSNPPGGEGNTPKTILARYQKSPDMTLNRPSSIKKSGQDFKLSPPPIIR